MFTIKEGTRDTGKGLLNKRALRRLLSATLAFLLIMSPAAGLYAAAELPEARDMEPEARDMEPEARDTEYVTKPREAAFASMTGEVTLITEWNGMPCIRVMSEEEGETDFVIEDGKTIFSDAKGLADSKTVSVGTTVSVYYVKPLLVTLQYPPRFDASIVVVSGDGPGTVFVGIVNKDGLADDGSVVLNVPDEVAATRQSDGLKYDKPLAGKALIAYYTVTTRSMPPIALVEKVIVLDKTGVPVYVNDVKIYNAEVIYNKDGVALAPLRAVVEALGYTIVWDEAAFSARVGVAIYVTIGSDEYLIGRAAPIKLEAAAELINDRTYAPISFYTQLLGIQLNDSSGLIMLYGDKA